MPDPRTPSETPSAHLLSLVGADLLSAPVPALRVEAAREVAVVLSRSRSPEREVVLDACRADGVPVLVRPSGGGAVVLAPGVVAASLVLAADPEIRFPEPYFRRFCGVAAGALESCGVEGVAVRGISDLAIGERKVAGSSLRLFAGRVLFQVSVLVDVDAGLFERYLRAPSREPEYRRGRPHRDFVVTLLEAGCDASREQVVGALYRSLAAEVARA